MSAVNPRPEDSLPANSSAGSDALSMYDEKDVRNHKEAEKLLVRAKYVKYAYCTIVVVAVSTYFACQFIPSEVRDPDTVQALRRDPDTVEEARSKIRAGEDLRRKEIAEALRRDPEIVAEVRSIIKAGEDLRRKKKRQENSNIEHILKKFVEYRHDLDKLPLVCAIPIVSPLIAWSHLLRKKAKRLTMRSAATAMMDDPRPPVLYLRSFRHDGSGANDPYWLNLKVFNLEGLPELSYEERLVEQLTRVGPVVAIGRPSEPIPEFGAARMYVEDDKWQQEVARLAEQSRLIVIRVGVRSGLLWEFEQVVSKFADKTIIYSEPSARIPPAVAALLPRGDDVLQLPPAHYVFYDAKLNPYARDNLLLILEYKKYIAKI